MLKMHYLVKKRSEYFTSERTIPKGTKLYRTTSQKDLLNESKDSIYVTYLEADRDLYKGGYIRKRDSTKTAYEHSMTLKDDLKIPSRDTFINSLNEVISKNPDLLKESVESYLDTMIPKGSFKRYNIMENPNTGLLDVNKWNEFIEKSIEKRKDVPINVQWGSIAVSLGKSDKLKDALIKSLKEKGYNAISDEAGVGGSERLIEGIDPLIVFNKNLLEYSGVSEISKKQEEKSNKNYNKWAKKARKNDNW